LDRGFPELQGHEHYNGGIDTDHGMCGLPQQEHNTNRAIPQSDQEDWQA
jgi:hypothetical protein